MKTSVHLVVSSILAAILYPLFNWKVLFILIGGVLIDVDHYLWYIYKYKKLSLFGCYKHYISQTEKNQFKENIGILLIFHTIEFLFIVTILSFYNEFALIFALGLLPHHILDLIFLYIHTKRFMADYSLIRWIYKNQIQKV